MPHSNITLLGSRGSTASRLRLIIVIAVLALLVGLVPTFAPRPAAAAAAYTVTDLGFLPNGNSAHGYAINASGQIAGYADVGDSKSHAFRWDPNADFSGGTLVDLGTLGGDNSYAAAINDHGHVAGHSATADGKDHAFAHNGEQLFDLRTLAGPAGAYSYAQAVNNNGDFVGGSIASTGNNVVAATFDGTNVTQLNPLAGDTHGTAYAIEQQGLKVGYSGSIISTSLVTKPVKWAANSATAVQLPGLGNRTQGEARAVNFVGTAAGIVSNGSGDAQAVIWRYNAAAPVLLGSLGGATSYAYGINNGGQVVGRADYGDGTFHAFVWNQGGGMVDLNTLIPSGVGWLMTDARGINDKGQIVATGTYGGKTRAYLLTPAAAHRTGPTPGPLDQQQALTTTNGYIVVNGEQIIGQTFTAGRTGSLDQVSVYITYQPSAGGADVSEGYPAGPGDLIVQIRTVDANGLPTDTILGGNSLIAASFTPQVGGFVDVPLLTSVPVTAGTQYALVLTSTQEGGSYSWSMGDNNPYAGGQQLYYPSGHWQVDPANRDYAFKTYVTGEGGSPSPSPSPAADYGITLHIDPASTGTGSVNTTPAQGPFATGSTVMVNAMPNDGSMLAGWTVDGTFRGYSNPLKLTMNQAHDVTVKFVTAPAPFPDIPTSGNEELRTAVAQLTAAGIFQGYPDGSFGPNNAMLRTHIANIIVRMAGWQNEQNTNPFTDRCLGPGTCISDQPNPRFPNEASDWTKIGTLNAHNGVAKGWDYNRSLPLSDPANQSIAATCGGAANVPCFLPFDNVLQVQTISFITRTMIQLGYWHRLPDLPEIYPNIPLGVRTTPGSDSGLGSDITTYVMYTIDFGGLGMGGVPGTLFNGNFTNWDTPATRGWTAVAIERALASPFDPENLVSPR